MEPDLALLDRYLAGDCTPAEAATVRRWIETRPGMPASLSDVHDIRAVAAGEAHWDTNAGWQSMTRQMAELGKGEPNIDFSATDVVIPTVRPSSLASRELPTISPSSKIPRARVVRWSAVTGLAGLFAATAIAIVVARPWSSANVSAQRVSTYATGNGQRSAVTLPDGTHVVLSVDSHLEVPVDYDRGNRRVTLSGEALFTVIHQSGTPFTVVAGKSETRVLGTNFLVRKYATDSAATVAVRDGKVMVRTTVVTAMQQVAVVNGTPGTVRDADTAQFTFASGVLTLSDMPLVKAIPELNRWYDADIKLGDNSLIRRRIAGGFVAGSSTDLAAVLERVYNVRIVRDGRTLTLYPGSR